MPNQRQSRRVIELDATRGAAMFFVCLSHSAALLASSQGFLASRFEELGMVATPTFLLLSGIVCGYLATARNEPLERFRWRLVDRGLFLLVVGHLVLGLEHVAWSGAGAALGGSFYITDAVAIGLIVAAIATQRMTPRMLAIVGIVLLLTALAASNLSPPRDALERLSLRLLFGVFSLNDESAGDEGYVVPLAPYLGVFLVGVALGIEYVKRRAAGATTVELATRCIVVGVIFMAAAVAMKIAYLAIGPYLTDEARQVLWMITEPRQKLPPGPAYWLAYGGAGATMVGLIGVIATSRIGGRLVSALAVVGRASFLIFVLQYLVYYLPAFGWHVGGGSWAFVFPLSLLALWGLAYQWDRFDGNRLYTIGIRRLIAATSR